MGILFPTILEHLARIMQPAGKIARSDNKHKVDQQGRGVSWEDDYPVCTVRSSIADARVAPKETKSNQIDREDYEKEERCSGRDLNPGSATRKAAMLDRTVQPFCEKMATTPPEHSQTL